MAKIRSRDTRPEVYIRSALFKRNFRFRVHYKAVEGRPDIYFPRIKAAIFIHGCYWHRHDGCKYAYTPKSHTDFWLAKFEENKKRDSLVYEKLIQNDIRVLIIWECTVRNMKMNADANFNIMNKLENFIFDNTQTFVQL